MRLRAGELAQPQGWQCLVAGHVVPRIARKIACLDGKAAIVVVGLEGIGWFGTFSVRLSDVIAGISGSGAFGSGGLTGGLGSPGPVA